jgi:hypothetical protein
LIILIILGEEYNNKQYWNIRLLLWIVF